MRKAVKKKAKKPEKAPKKKKLTPKKENFCQEYLLDFNASRAARAAGYSVATAYSIGSELLRKPEIQDRINELRTADLAKFNVTKESLMNQLMSIARTDIREIFDPENGQLKPVAEWPDHVAAAVSSVETDELFTGFGKDREQIGWTRKVKTSDKTKAIEVLNKMLGFNMPDKIANTDPAGNFVGPPVINIIVAPPPKED